MRLNALFFSVTVAYDNEDEDEESKDVAVKPR